MKVGQENNDRDLRLEQEQQEEEEEEEETGDGAPDPAEELTEEDQAQIRNIQSAEDWFDTFWVQRLSGKALIDEAEVHLAKFLLKRTVTSDSSTGLAPSLWRYLLDEDDDGEERKGGRNEEQFATTTLPHGDMTLEKLVQNWRRRGEVVDKVTITSLAIRFGTVFESVQDSLLGSNKGDSSDTALNRTSLSKKLWSKLTLKSLLKDLNRSTPINLTQLRAFALFLDELIAVVIAQLSRIGPFVASLGEITYDLDGLRLLVDRMGMNGLRRKHLQILQAVFLDEAFASLSFKSEFAAMPPLHKVQWICANQCEDGPVATNREAIRLLTDPTARQGPMSHFSIFSAVASQAKLLTSPNQAQLHTLIQNTLHDQFPLFSSDLIDVLAFLWTGSNEVLDITTIPISSSSSSSSSSSC